MTYKKGNYGYHEFTYVDGDIEEKIGVRNVGDRNPESMIQITLERYNRYKERSLPFVSFSIPQADAEQFIKAVSVERERT